MRVRCAWCKCDVDCNTARSPNDCVVSHGICETCAYLFEHFEPVRIGELLDRLTGSVLLVDPDGRVVSGNTAAARLVRKERDSLCGLLGGEVIECVHSREPGGCGRTEHCTGCTIRGTVRHTRETGESRRRVEAYQHVFSPAGVQHLRVWITTERLHDCVLLRIDAMEPLAPPPMPARSRPSPRPHKTAANPRAGR